MSAAIGRPVVVGVDGSAASLASITLAAREATLRGRPLRLVHADSWAAHPAWVDTDPGGSLAEDLPGDPEGIVKEAVEKAGEVATTPVTAEVVPGEPGTVLARESHAAELVVVCHRGAGGFLGLRLGSVAIKVAAHARCPVLVTRGTPVPGGPLLVGVDWSAANQHPVGFAFEEATLRDAELVALHGWTGPVYPGSTDLLPLVPDPVTVRGQEAERLTLALRDWAERYPRIRVRPQLVRARAASALVAASEYAQLVVVGTRGTGGRPVLPFGSVTHALLHHSACPVVVVPGR